ARCKARRLTCEGGKAQREPGRPMTEAVAVTVGSIQQVVVTPGDGPVVASYPVANADDHAIPGQACDELTGWIGWGCSERSTAPIDRLCDTPPHGGQQDTAKRYNGNDPMKKTLLHAIVLPIARRHLRGGPRATPARSVFHCCGYEQVYFAW